MSFRSAVPFDVATLGRLARRTPCVAVRQLSRIFVGSVWCGNRCTALRGPP